MNDDKINKEQLIRRRDEILAELDRVGDAERIELDRDPEEQAIELEQEDVARTMDQSLRKELDEIESRLAEMGG